jgi:hypothetical protein
LIRRPRRRHREHLAPAGEGVAPSTRMAHIVETA